MKLKFLLVFVTLLLCGCLSYQDLHEMKSVENKADAKENLVELLETLEEPCEDPNFYSHVMETAAFLRKGLILNGVLNDRYENAFYQIITSFNLSESDEWEVKDISAERDYLQALALQLVLDRQESNESVFIIKKYFNERRNFSKEQWLIYIKAVERNKLLIQKDTEFCNKYLPSFFFTKHHFSGEENKFFATQMDFFLNYKSAFLFSSFLKIYNPDKNCLNSLLEYTYKNGFEFDEHYSVESLLKDLATFKIKNTYQQNLRSSLYLKYLNFQKMNTLVSGHFNEDILRLNEQLLTYSMNRKLQWSKTAFHKNLNMLLNKSRAKTSLALRTKEMLMSVAPGYYGLSLIERKQDSKSFADVLSLFEIIHKHKTAFKAEGHAYNIKGQNFLNPYFLIEKKSAEDLWLKKYIYNMAQSYGLGFLNSEQSPANLRPFTLALQAYKLAEMDVFSGAYGQEKLLHTILAQGKKGIDETLISYLINLSEDKTLSTFMNYLNKGSFRTYQLMAFTGLFEKTKVENKALLKKNFSALLLKRLENKNDEVSLHALKLAFRLNFLNKEFNKTADVRWPHLKALKGEE